MSKPVRFGPFEAELRTGELRKGDVKLRLSEQPFQVLAALLEKPGELVTREELKDRLWPDDAFVGFEDSLNTAVNKLRQTLGDSARKPKYVETLQGRGYRFIAPVEMIGDSKSGPQPGPWSRVAAALIAVAAAIYLAWPPDASAPLRFTERPLTFEDGNEQHPSLSPDGTRVAYRGTGLDGSPDIYVKVVDEPAAKAQRITQGPENEMYPRWSPDGARLAFIRHLAATSYQLLVVPASGGEPDPLYSFSSQWMSGMSPSWSTDGQHIAFTGQLLADGPAETNRLLLYSFETKQTQPVLEDDHQHVIFSPDGKRLAFEQWTSGGDPGVFAVDLDQSLTPKGRPRLVASGRWSGASWSPDGQSLFLVGRGNESGLFRIDASGSGQPKFLHPLDGLPSQVSVGLGPSGRLRAVVAVDSSDIDVMRLSLETPDAKLEPLIRTNRVEERPDYSPNGQRIAFRSNRSGRKEIWVSNSTGEGQRPLTEGADLFGQPRWSPTGLHIAFSELEENGLQMYVLEVEGAGGLRPLGPGRKPSWSSDGLSLYHFSKGVADQAQSRAIRRVRVEGGGEVELVADLGQPPESGAQMGLIREAPDGRSLYWTQDGRLMSAPLGEDGSVSADPKPVAEDALSEGFSVIGDADGHTVYYCTSQNVIKRYRPETGQSETLRRLEDTIDSGCSVSPDRRWLIYDRRVRSGYDLMLLEGVQ